MRKKSFHCNRAKENERLTRHYFPCLPRRTFYFMSVTPRAKPRSRGVCMWYGHKKGAFTIDPYNVPVPRNVNRVFLALDEWLSVWRSNWPWHCDTQGGSSTEACHGLTTTATSSKSNPSTMRCEDRRTDVTATFFSFFIAHTESGYENLSAERGDDVAGDSDASGPRRPLVSQHVQGLELTGTAS